MLTIFIYTIKGDELSVSNLTKAEIIKVIIEDVDDELTDEEIIHLVLEKKVSQIIDVRKSNQKSFGQQKADEFAKFAGSWRFVIGFCIVLCIWIVINSILAAKAFDPFPFILLNLVLSCIAAIQAPMIMMSQNRQEEKDRNRAENDYKVNLKTEIIIQDMHSKLDLILENQEKLFGDFSKE